MAEPDATSATVALRSENERLRTELSALREQLRSCRQCVAGAAEAERRRIERDLHDAIQGRLVWLAMLLGHLEAKLPGDPCAASPIARKAREGIGVALEELRDLTHGIYPAILAERGLREALEELCRPTTYPVVLEVSLDRRLPPDVEAAVYFVASEALTNAVKHANARRVRVSLADKQQRLVLEVADDGIGGASVTHGSGLHGLLERIEALGGRVTLSSPPGHGTRLYAEVPCH